MDAGGGTGSIPFPFLPLSKRPKKSKFGDRTQKHYLTKKERTVHPALPQKKKREKYKNTNTLNMDVACEAIDGLALLYLFDIHRVPWVHTVSEFE